MAQTHTYGVSLFIVLIIGGLLLIFLSEQAYQAIDAQAYEAKFSSE
jgi:hypothetical protein